MKLQATFPKRRDGSYGSVTVLINGKRVAHPIDRDGYVEVPDEQAHDLVGTGNFVSDDGSLPADGDEAMMITNGEISIDLMKLSKAELLTMARDEMGLDVTARNNAQSLREAIHAHVSQ